MADRVQLRSLPPEEAIAFFRAKGLATSFAWQDVWQEEHARAFTVAKAMSRDVLVDVRAALDTALAEGKTFEQFRNELRPLLQARGWWGKSRMVDPATGEARNVQLGSTRRLRTIFDTNLRSAYQAGRWERVQASKAALPYLLYNHTPQSDPRPEHQAWDKTCLPVDHPWWTTHYCPNGWGCKCWTMQLSQAAMERRGLTLTEKPIRFPPKVYTNPRTGEVMVIEGGIDPGFNFNIGQAYLDPATPRPTPLPPAPAAPIRPAPDLAPAREGPSLLAAGTSAREAQAAFLEAFGATEARPVIFTDPGGEPFVASGGLFKTLSGKPVRMSAAKVAALPLVARAIRYPDEIRRVWREASNGAPQLLRRYVARLSVDGREISIVADASLGGGWSFATSLDKGFDLAKMRGGELVWRRVTAAELGMTPPEREALSLYTRFAYSDFNRHLRFGDPADPETRAHVAALGSLLSRSSLATPMILHRTVTGELAEQLSATARRGTILEDLGFMSSSRDPIASRRFEQDWDGALFMVIRARAGDAALDVSTWSGTPHEHEVLFARGTRLKVVGYDDETRTLTLETVGPEAE